MGNFSDIYGYETIKEHLQSAISMGKVSHAYVISGNFEDKVNLHPRPLLLS